MHTGGILGRIPLKRSLSGCGRKLLICKGLNGARWWIRTTDPRRVKAVLYR
jgi:hypothetical protein